MRRLLLTLLLILAHVCYAQERQDGIKGSYKILPKQSQIITTMVGWAYDNSYEKWAGYKNLIMGEYKRGNNKTPIMPSIEELSEGLDNILSFKFKSVTVNGSHYNALYVISWNHYYDYPRIYEGRHNYKTTEVFLFNDEEYMKLFNLDEGINKISITSYKDYGTGGRDRDQSFPNEREMYAGLANEMEKANTNPQASRCVFYVRKENDKTIRFQYPGRYRYLKEEYDIIPESLGKWYDRNEVCDFSKEYFELPISQWNLLKMK